MTPSLKLISDSVRRSLAQAVTPDKTGQPRSRSRSREDKFTAFTKRSNNRKLAKTLYTIYENGGEISHAIDVYALFAVSSQPAIMADEIGRASCRERV